MLIVNFTFVFWCKLLHFRWQRLIKALLPADEWLANCVVIVAHHASMAAHLVNKGFEWHPSTTSAMPMPLVLACVRCIVVFARLHGVRDAHGADRPRRAGGMGSSAQARRAWGTRGWRLGAHTAARRGRSQPAGHAHQPIDPDAKRVGARPYRCVLKERRTRI